MRVVCAGLRTSVSIEDSVRLFACWTACVSYASGATVHCGNVVVSKYREQILC